MIKVIKSYLDKNLFYVSVILTGVTSLLFGIFYSLFKNNVFDMASNDFLEGTGVLSAYVTTSTNRPSEVNYFLVGLVLSLAFFFVISLIWSLYLKKSYMKVFNLVSILNVILIIGLILSCIFIGIFNIFTYIILIVIILLYLFGLYLCFNKILDLDKKKTVISLAFFVLLVIIILILLKLFV